MEFQDRKTITVSTLPNLLACCLLCLAQASFFGVAVLFCICLYTNVKVLEISNVETVIVFRSLSPMFVCVVEVFVMRSRIPSMWTWLCLCGIGAGAYGYCISEREGAT